MSLTPALTPATPDGLQLPLRLHLHGRQVIEASAGTGKTWTLAALYVRLVLGHGRDAPPLLPPQILVMTFTDAATAELRERIRTRLQEAAHAFDVYARGGSLEAEDAFTRQLRLDIAPEHWATCALQLHLAADWMDEAAIYTLHSWSRRMLAQHALSSGHLFEQTHLEDAARLQLELAQDYWRQWFYPLPADTLGLLRPLIGEEPRGWLRVLRRQWQLWERTPQTHADPIDSPHDLAQALQQWQADCAQHAHTARASWSDAVWQAVQATRIKGARADYYAKWIATLQQWVSQSAVLPDAATRKVLERFTLDALQAKAWEAAQAHAFFAHLQTYIEALEREPDVHARLVAHAAHHIGQAYAQAKQQRAAFDFQDLLQQLYAALDDDARASGTLAQTIRTQYPVALIDEFQDTDPWQYGSLDRIYAHDAVQACHALILIGDPKQAIYRFRGADLSTYLRARDEALRLDPHALHTLEGNHRCSAPLLRAIEHVFTRSAHPFHVQAQDEARIDYVRVQPRAQVDPWPVDHGRAMTVWHLPMHDGKPLSQAAYWQPMADVFASHMVDLLQAGLAQPGDMAVLVRQHQQAQAIQTALRARGVASVYVSDRSSVYDTPEAMDLWRVLRALASPRDLFAVRAAVASQLWGWSMPQVQSSLEDPDQWEALLTQCHQWHQRWQQHGVLPMLYHWMHEARIAQRLLSQPDGQRRLSHVLHLGELLQHASMGLQGTQALVRWLHTRIDEQRQGMAHTSAQEQTTRLETDAQCVQVITYHKSKGLEYPLVFLPFMGSFSYKQDDEDEPDATVEEDVRLIYVALTRAKRALWLGVAETPNDIHSEGEPRSALSHLLQRHARGDLLSQLHTLWGDCPDIGIAPAPDAHTRLYQPHAPASLSQDALTPSRTSHSTWWTASFSTLTRGLVSQAPEDESVLDALHDAALDEAHAHDEMQPAWDGEHDASADLATTDPPAAWQSFSAGARYGTLLHDLLQWQAEHGWPLADPDAPTSVQAQWARVWQLKAEWLQLNAADLALLQPWLQRIIQTPIPLAGQAPPLRLQDVRADQMWAEMAFHFPLAACDTEALDRLIGQHLLPEHARPALQARSLQGMMTGFMDLVLAHPTPDGTRYWVMDYKSNKLPSYDDAQLTQAVLDKRYEVQYTLYILALHRLLRVRLHDYDYDTHIGGAVYVFLRGIDAPNAGTHSMRPSRALIEALDALFAGNQEHA